MRSHPWKTYTDRIALKNASPKAGTIIVATKSTKISGYKLKEQAPKKAKGRGWRLYIVKISPIIFSTKVPKWSRS
jgi:hypothetical protein